MRALGFNYRVTDFQCALGLSQLERVDGWVEERNLLANRYRELLAEESRLTLPPTAPDGWRHGHHLFPVVVAGGPEVRRSVFDSLRAAGIGVQVHYIPVYRLSYYREQLGYPQDECPAAEDYYAGAISLPMFPGLEQGDLDRVVSELGKALP
jgi:dTDP-4-amino-4,6-dideoxygalactose transaminase